MHSDTLVVGPRRLGSTMNRSVQALLLARLTLLNLLLRRINNKLWPGCVSHKNL